MLDKLRRHLKNVTSASILRAELSETRQVLAQLRESVGRLEARQTRSTTQSLAEVEFRVFSQWGEDGIIQHLIRNVVVPQKSFIEFGVESYREANTRFLLMHDNWRGLIIDGGHANIQSIRGEDLYWRYDLTAVEAFIRPSNINELFINNGFSGPIGLLSVDIDGVDYHVWNAIDVITPAIVIVEYNARFGPERAVTVPLNEAFTRNSAHYSNIYYGASLAAFTKLANSRGYSLVGCNSNGNNAFFVKDELMPPGWRALTSAEAYVANRFRESRTPEGQLALLNFEKECAIVNSLPLIEV